MKAIKLIGSVALIGLSATCLAQPAFAHSSESLEPTADAAATAIAGVSADLIAEPAELTDTGSALETVTDDDSAVSIARDPLLGVEIVDADGSTATIKIPEPELVDLALPEAQGLVAFEGTEGYVTSVIPSDGGAQFLTTIVNAEAPEQYAYDLVLPAGATVSEDDGETGALAARDAEGELLFLVAPAWAVDASGEPVPTRYEFTDDTLTQIVDHQSADFEYPIVADPNVNGKLIKSYKWVSSKQGYTISVAVTPAMGWASITTANKDGWSELNRAVKKHSKASTYTLLSIPSMKQQWGCHALGKAAIGIGGWLGIDKKPTWDLETWRKTLGPKNGPATMINKRCNW